MIELFRAALLVVELTFILSAGVVVASVFLRGAYALDAGWRRLDLWLTIRVRHLVRRRRHRRRTGHARCVAA